MKKHKLVLLSISLGMIKLSCGNISNTDFDSKNSNENIERNKRNGESIQSQNDNKNQTGPQIEKTDYQITDAKATRFGNRTVGYISLGNGWKQLENTGGQGEITYIGYDESSITLYLTPKSQKQRKSRKNLNYQKFRLMVIMVIKYLLIIQPGYLFEKIILIIMEMYI